MTKMTFVFPGETSSPRRRKARGFSSRRPPGGCDRGGVWIIPTGRRKRTRTFFSRNTNIARHGMSGRDEKNETRTTRTISRAPAGLGEASLESGQPQGGALFPFLFPAVLSGRQTRRSAPSGLPSRVHRTRGPAPGSSGPDPAEGGDRPQMGNLSHIAHTASGPDSALHGASGRDRQHGA